MQNQNNAIEYVNRIRQSGLSIYDEIEVGSPLWIPTKALEEILNQELKGTNLGGMALRTRSKFVKTKVCEALGYPVPASFKKTQPRFFGQQFDVYSQKSNNLQIWNEELSASRRYVLIDISADDFIRQVKVVTGDMLAKLDTTGTLTQKYQARLTLSDQTTELISQLDTTNIRNLVQGNSPQGKYTISPTTYPNIDTLLPIKTIFDSLTSLVGRTFADAGIDQERNRGATLHKLITSALGYSSYHDSGTMPDIMHQLLEIKLQTSPTIDLGLVLPNSTEMLDVPKIKDVQIRYCDVRYAIFYSKTDGSTVKLTHFFLTTGEQFFERFEQFGGKTLNKKLQIPLPRNFFTD